MFFECIMANVYTLCRALHFKQKKSAKLKVQRYIPGNINFCYMLNPNDNVTLEFCTSKIAVSVKPTEYN